MSELRKLRREKGYSQEKMASLLGMSLSMYSKVEQGKVQASMGFMKKIKAQFPDANIDQIFFGTNSNIIADSDATRRKEVS